MLEQVWSFEEEIDVNDKVRSLFSSSIEVDEETLIINLHIRNSERRHSLEAPEVHTLNVPIVSYQGLLRSWQDPIVIAGSTVLVCIASNSALSIAERIKKNFDDSKEEDPDLEMRGRISDVIKRTRADSGYFDNKVDEIIKDCIKKILP